MVAALSTGSVLWLMLTVVSQTVVAMSVFADIYYEVARRKG